MLVSTFLPLAAAASDLPAAASADYRQQADSAIQGFHWDEALRIYRDALAKNPNDAEAWRGIGRILRWQGHLEESREAYEKAAALEPKNPSAALGIADAYRLDHNYAQARASYEAAAQKWPDSEEVRQGRHDFLRDDHPRLFSSYDKDLSSREWSAGIAVPLLSREEIRLEKSAEDRNDASYRRTDEKIDFAHYFGLNHFAEVRLRRSQYTYPGVVSDFTAIDKFDEIRLRYSQPLTPEQVLSATYTHRLNTLQASGEKYTSHKLEVELRSQWTPRFATLLGGGSLRDLRGSATSTKDFHTTSLARAGVEYALTQKADVAATFITNPDLDNSISSKTLLQLGYQWSDSFSTLARYRYDKYKEGANQQVYFAGLRYSPNAHFWSELGVQTARRGDRTGTYPLASMVYKF